MREASTPGDPSGTPPEPARTDEQKAASVERILRGELTAEQVCLEEGVPRSELEQWARIYRRAARRAVDDQLTAVLSARGLEVDEGPATEFSGSLDALALAELIQTLRYGRKDAQIRIEHEGEQSHVWCVAGDVVDAESGQLSGNAAMYRLLALQQGRVHADFLPVRRARTIHTSTQALLLEAAQRSDECQELRRRLGDTRALYVPSGSAPTHAPTEPGHAQVLAAFDGRRTLDEIVRASELPDLETLAIIAGLVERRWVEPKPPPRPASPAAERRGSVAVQRSFSPTVASVGLRSPRKSAGVSRLWLSAASGVALVCGAFAIGFWSARKDVSLRAAAAKSRAPQVCPAGMSALSQGVCLSDTEVTAGQYQACVAAGVCQADWSPAGAPPAATSPASSPGDDFAARCNGGQPGREQYPINCVNFRQAQRYCEWRGERLPSDAEWTLAASRVGEGASGITDLLGSVSEWTSGSAPSRAGDPGDGADARQVVLGAGFATGQRAPTLSGLFMNANAQGRRVGFRCARELPSVTPGSASAS